MNLFKHLGLPCLHFSAQANIADFFVSYLIRVILIIENRNSAAALIVFDVTDYQSFEKSQTW